METKTVDDKIAQLAHEYAFDKIGGTGLYHAFIAGYTAAQSEQSVSKSQFNNQMKHKESIKQYWLSCAKSKEKWVEAIKEYFDGEHTESIQSFDAFKEQFDLD